MNDPTTTWEIANPITAEEVLELMQSGATITGTLKITLKANDEETVKAVEEAAAKAGIVLVRT